MYEFYAGCDTHKEKHFISIINSKGQLQESFEIKNSQKGWDLSLNIFKKYSEILIGIENTANYARKFGKFLLQNNLNLKEVNPVFVCIK